MDTERDTPVFEEPGAPADKTPIPLSKPAAAPKPPPIPAPRSATAATDTKPDELPPPAPTSFDDEDGSATAPVTTSPNRFRLNRGSLAAIVVALIVLAVGFFAAKALKHGGESEASSEATTVEAPAAGDNSANEPMAYGTQRWISDQLVPKFNDMVNRTGADEKKTATLEDEVAALKQQVAELKRLGVHPVISSTAAVLEAIIATIVGTMILVVCYWLWKQRKLSKAAAAPVD